MRDYSFENGCRAGYKQGYEDAKEDVWNIARKTMHDRDDDQGLDLRELVPIFGTASFDRILKENTASEAIAKIKEYENKHKVESEKKFSYSERTIENVVEIVRVMPYQFTLAEIEKFTSLLNERLDEILEIHKAERSEQNG